jgi:lysophospholipase L1-like esterase
MISFSSLHRRVAWGALPLLIVALVLGGCDDEQLLTDAPESGDLFDRYAAIGNSITAGFQSNGISVSTQQESYANLLAGQMGTDFTLPALNNPGCPPPLTQIFPVPQAPDGPPCSLRETPVPTTLNNVAVPGAGVADVLSNTDAASSANTLTSFILGGRTQIEAAKQVQPTFVTAWIGNNDVLEAALAGTSDLVTPVEDFQSRYSTMLSEFDQMEDLEGAALFGVVDVTLTPNLSPGAAYAQVVPQAQQAGVLPPNLEVANSCAPSSLGGVGDQMLVPFQYGVTLVAVAGALFQQAGPNAPDVTLDCGQDLTVEQAVGQTFGGVNNIPPSIQGVIEDVRTISILTSIEVGTIKGTAQAYNAFIQQQANERGYAYVDVNALFQQPELRSQIPIFPELFDVPGNDFTPDQPFGPLFSLDGVHPSAAAHEVVTNAAIEAINDQYGTNIPSLGSQ